MKKLIAVCLTALLTVSMVACTGAPAQSSGIASQPESAASSQEQTRVVQDARGDVKIPANPKRIVDLSGNSDTLALLGISVVGSANSDSYDHTQYPSYLKETLKDAKIVGFSYQETMDVENIMNLEPDLIVISAVQEKMYEQLSEIAPTVMLKADELDWKSDIRSLAKLFDKEKEAETWIKDYESAAKSAGDAIKKKYGDDASYLSFLASGGQFYVFSGAGFGDIINTDLGLKRPTNMPEQTNVSLPVVTYEGLAAIDSDIIFVLGTEEDLAKLQVNAIWKGLPAVKSGKVVVLPSSPYFNQGYSPIGKQLLLKEIPELLNGIQSK